MDPSTGDYHIGGASTAIDKGMETTVDTDCTDARPVGPAPDIGADEWNGFRIFLSIILRNFRP